MHQQPHDVPHKTQSPVLMSPSSLQTLIKAMGWEKRLQRVSVCLRVWLGERGWGAPGGCLAFVEPHGEVVCVPSLTKVTQTLYTWPRGISGGPLPIPVRQVSLRSLGSTPDLPFLGHVT